MIRLEVLAEAASDLERAAIWYESQRLNLGDEFTGGARSLLKRIEENPLPFAIYFRLAEDRGLVVAVMDLRRKASRWKGRI